jgi:hypothetical protein
MDTGLYQGPKGYGSPHSPYTAMLSPCAQPRLRFFSEATIEAGFFSTSEPNAGT